MIQNFRKNTSKTYIAKIFIIWYRYDGDEEQYFDIWDLNYTDFNTIIQDVPDGQKPNFSYDNLKKLIRTVKEQEEIQDQCRPLEKENKLLQQMFKGKKDLYSNSNKRTKN